MLCYTEFVYRYEVRIIDSTNLKAKEWVLTTYVQAKNKEDSERMIKEYYNVKGIELISYELLDVIETLKEQ